DGHGLQQGRKEQRQIGKPRMGRHERNEGIDEGGHKNPALLVSPAVAIPGVSGRKAVLKSKLCQLSQLSTAGDRATCEEVRGLPKVGTAARHNKGDDRKVPSPPVAAAKIRRDSQGSPPKFAFHAYLDENTGEL
ncbi:MAG: hypothetical protein JOZ76_17315, partial [Bradyrhizobium sp.]|nr:hypothetical protein [Bradyrhizobium sp.]